MKLKLTYFRHPTVEAVAAQLLTPEQRQFMIAYPLSEEFAQLERERIVLDD